MPIRRAVYAVIGLVIFSAAGLATVEAIAHRGMTGVSTMLLCTVAVLGVLQLYLALLDERRRAKRLEASASALQTLTEKLEESLATHSAINARLHESEVRYKGLVDAQGDAIFRRSPDSRLTYGNDAFFRLFGLDPEQTVGQPFAPEPHPESRHPIFESFGRLETGPRRMRYDQRIRTVYGWRWISWEDYVVSDTSGRLIEVQSVGRDITEHKALEEALTDARDRAEAANRAKTGFLAAMSHEIRTPMNGVLGMARLLLETKLLPDQRTYAEAIQQCGEALLSLLDEILDFSRIESGTVEIEAGEFDARTIAEATVELLAPRAHDKGIEIATTFEPGIPSLVRIDGIRLRQILTNLIGNAVKFTQTGGVWLDVRATEERDRHMLRFEIHDTGIGVPPAMRGDIFREFMQVDSSQSRRFEGTGLGLTICKRLVDAMGGAIGVESRDAGGSTFWFTIPAPVLTPAPPGQGRKLAGQRVAIVTRNSMLRAGLAAQIAAAGGEVAPLIRMNDTGQPAPRQPDVILIDAGPNAEIELPAQPAPWCRNIVLLTPAARGKLDLLRDMGFATYLVKPVRQTSLIAQIRNAPDLDVREQPPEMVVADRLQNAPPSQVKDRQLRILLAEDNPINALLTRELLQRRGHHVTEVVSGEDAITALERSEYDILLTDIHMPGMDGVEAARRIRSAEVSAGRVPTPIVALTADVLDAGRQACQDVGMDGFLSKPISPAELDKMLAKLVPESLPEAAE